MMKTAPTWARWLMWLLAIPLWVLTHLTLFSAINAHTRYDNRHGYRDANFVVSGAAVTGRYGSVAYLTGHVDGHEEIFIPEHGSDRGTDGMLRRFPVGSSLRVKINPSVDATLIQYESNRVLSPDWDFKEDGRLTRSYNLKLLLPSMGLAAALYLTRPGRSRRAQ